jgi:hypothetical protein
MFLIIAFNENFTKIRITEKIMKKFISMDFIAFCVRRMNDENTYGQRSKGVWSFLFLTVKSAPLAARKQAIDADAFLSVFCERTRREIYGNKLLNY